MVEMIYRDSANEGEVSGEEQREKEYKAKIKDKLRILLTRS